MITPARPPVDVIIVNYRTPELTESLVRRLASDQVNVFVWDNSNDIESASLPRGHRVYGNGENVMFASGSNRLFALSSAPLVLLLNPDVELDASQLWTLVDALSSDPRAWGAAPRLVSPDGADQNYVRRLPTFAAVAADRVPPLRGVLGRSYRRYWCLDVARDKDGLVEQPAAACLLLRRAELDGVLFDEGYPLFFNDTDLARRMNATGGHCRYLGTLAVRHLGGEAIRRERESNSEWIRDEYDRSYLRYCRLNLAGWPLLAPIFFIRWTLRRLSSVLGR